MPMILKVKTMCCAVYMYTRTSLGPCLTIYLTQGLKQMLDAKEYVGCNCIPAGDDDHSSGAG